MTTEPIITEWTCDHETRFFPKQFVAPQFVTSKSDPKDWEFGIKVLGRRWLSIVAWQSSICTGRASKGR